MTAAEAELVVAESLPISADACELSQIVKPLNIALLGYRSHPHVGGQGIYLKYLSAALCDLGHRVDVFSGPPYPELDPRVKLVRVPSLDLFACESHVRAIRPRHLLSFSDFFEWWTMLTGGFAEPYTFGRRVQCLLGGTRYDIIHDNQSLSYALLELQKRGLTVVSTIHHPIQRDRDLALAAASRWGDRLLIKRWYSFVRMQERVVKGLDHVITVSQASQHDIARCFARDSVRTPVIGNGIDTVTFRPRKGVAREPFRIITTASSDQPLKGLKYLLHAVAQLRADYPQIHLRVIGKLKKEGAARKTLDHLALGDKVSFVSGISTEKLVAEYALASVAVCPSLYEGFGLPAGEAMACELPLITTDGGALPEVAGEAALVVPTGSSSAIAAHLKFLFDNPDRAKALGQGARKHIVEHFSWQRVALRLSHYYQDILHDADH